MVEIVKYGGAEIRLYPRANGCCALKWHEDGKVMRTTRATVEKARDYAKRKVREMQQATGKEWVTPLRMERLAWLERLHPDPGRLLAAVERAAECLGDVERLEEAAEFFMKHGPPAVRNVTLCEAAEMVLLEVHGRNKVDLHQELRTWRRLHPDFPLLEMTYERLVKHISLPGLAARSLRNRMARWTTFFRRCQVLGLWPEARPLPTKAMKRPRLADKAPVVFSPAEGKVLLAAVRKGAPEHLAFLLLGGWMGLRPSECGRLKWADVLWEQRLLHVTAAVAGKTSRERWVPIPAAMVRMLKAAQAREEDWRMVRSKRICRSTAQGVVSGLARAAGLTWTPDVLRHSGITYRLQVVGSMDQVAEEAGNSPGIIRSTYRRPLPPGEGRKWFALLERRTSNIGRRTSKGRE